MEDPGGRALPEGGATLMSTLCGPLILITLGPYYYLKDPYQWKYYYG